MPTIPPPPALLIPSKKGFTLIELLVVVLIIGILAAVALPQYTKTVEMARTREAVINLKAVLDAQERYYLETGTYTNDITELDVDIPADKFTYLCWENRTCSATPKNSTDYKFEFHTQKGGSSAAHISYGGARWCRALTAKGHTMCTALGGKKSTVAPHTETSTYYDLP